MVRGAPRRASPECLGVPHGLFLPGERRPGRAIGVHEISPAAYLRQAVVSFAPVEELGQAVDLIVIPRVREGKDLMQEATEPGRFLGKKTWPASKRGLWASMRTSLSPSGLIPIGTGTPASGLVLSSCTRWRPGPVCSIESASGVCSCARAINFRLSCGNSDRSRQTSTR